MKKTKPIFCLTAIFVLLFAALSFFTLQTAAAASSPVDIGLGMPFLGKSWQWSNSLGPHPSGIAKVIKGYNGANVTHIGGSTTKSGLDFSTYNEERNVVVSAPGFVHVECYHSQSKMAIVNVLHVPENSTETSGYGTSYVHVKINVREVYDGLYVQRGDVLGVTVKGKQDNRCGFQTGAHLHFGIVKWKSGGNGKIDYRKMTYTDQPIENTYMGGWILQYRNITRSEINSKENKGSGCRADKTQWVMVWRDKKTYRCLSSAIWSNAALPVGDGHAPDGITLLSPLDKSLTTSEEVDIVHSWTRHNSFWANPVAYQIQVARDELFEDIFLDTKLDVTSFHWRYPSIAQNYYWRVRGIDLNGMGPWTNVGRFSKVPLFASPALVSPSDKSVVPSADVVFTWEPVSGATEYYIEYGGDMSGNSGWINQTSFSVNLPAGNYTWRVRARNANGESGWSPSWGFAVEPDALKPAVPSLVSPLDNSTIGTNVVFSWDVAGNAIEYYLEYTGPASGNSGWVTDTDFLASLPAGAYTWRVKARNASSEGSWSGSWAFTVQAEPAVAPTLISPSDAGVVDPGVTLMWNALSDATEYYVEYNGTASGNSGWISGTSCTVTLPTGTYTWQVKARNAGGESDWSAAWMFTVQTPALVPETPVLSLPSHNATIIDTSVAFSWNIVSNATEYYLEYSGGTSGNSGWIAATALQPVLPSGAYAWRVKARNAGGESMWSETRSFVLQSPPSLLTINSPTGVSPTGSCSTSNWMTFTNNLGHTWYTTQNYKSSNPWAPNPNYAVWKTAIPISGYYKIEAYIPSHGILYWCGAGGNPKSVNTNDAHYQIYSSGAWRNVEKSQNIGGNVWLNLGEFYLNSGTRDIVKLIDSNHQTSYSQLILFSDIRITWMRQ